MPSTCADPYLVSVEEEESNHEGEQAGGFGEGKAENGILEELSWSTRPVRHQLALVKGSDDNLPRTAGLRAVPWIKAPKTFPIPTPAPARPIVAKPAPWTLAAAMMAAVVDSTTTPRDCMAVRMTVGANLLLMRPLRPAGWRTAERMELGMRAVGVVMKALNDASPTTRASGCEASGSH